MSKMEGLKAYINGLRRSRRVMEMQQLLNRELKKHVSIRWSYGGIRRKIPDFCIGIMQMPEYERYKDLTLHDLLQTWGPVSGMAPMDLDDLVKLTDEEIEKAKKGLKQC